MFSKVIKRNSQESYHWISDGRDELALKEDVWNSVKGYVKKRNIDKEIYGLLVHLRGLSEAFNKMGGALYSGICADEMDEIIDELRIKYKIEIYYWQPMAGRVDFKNLDELIKKCEKSGQQTTHFVIFRL
jgi:hypothetical protein